MLNVNLNFVSSLPLHVQLRDRVLNAISSGDIQSGRKLPAVNRLCKILSVSAVTVKLAYRQLEQEQFIYHVKGEGYFVAERKEENTAVIVGV